MAKKITKEELASLNEAVNRMQAVRSQLGDIELNKRNLFNAFDEAQNSVKEHQQSLEAKYGSVTINLSTGEYEEQVEEAVVAEE
jgi:hypothetical protein